MTLVVAVTRPEPQAAGTIARLSALGYSPLPAPLLSAVPAPDAGPADGIGALALTSRTAAMVLAPHPRFHALPVYAVGTATAEEARRAGFTAVRDAAGTVDDLLAALEAAEGPIVHMAGQEHTGDLVERLLALGRKASRRIVYRMAPRALPLVDAVDRVLLYSPRTARLFAERGGAAPWATAACIAMSPNVAAELPGRDVDVAREPTEAAMFEALAGSTARRTPRPAEPGGQDRHESAR